MMSSEMSYQNKSASSPSDIFKSSRDRNLSLACVLFFSPISSNSTPSVRRKRASTAMLRLKRFVSHHRQPPILNSARSGIEDLRFTETKLSTNPIKRLSWLSQSPSIEYAPLRRTNSQTTVRTYCNRTASTTAHSSATSLYSCYCGTNPASVELPLKEPAASNHAETLYLPPLSPNKASNDAQTWRLIFSESPSRSLTSSISNSCQRDNSPATVAAGSTFDLIEARSLEAPDPGKTPIQSFTSLYDSEMDGYSDDVEQLIRETDAAFQAVGIALADAKTATRGWYNDDVLVERGTSVTGGIPRRNLRLLVTPLKMQALRSMSVAKKKKPVKRNLLRRELRSVPQPAAIAPSRWTLNEVTTNVTDVFSGKIFRTEVDELLTPGRLQKLQESTRLSTERRDSLDIAHIAEAEDDIDTPTEPFYLESLSNRIDVARRNFPPSTSPVIPPPVIPQRHPNRPSRSKPPRKVQFADNEAGMTVNELTFPSPPRVSISRRSSASGNVSYLPTIPEISPLTPSPAEHRTSTSSVLRPVSSQPVEEESYIYLPCTPFTLTSPLFRHGTIRVPVPYREPDSRSDEEPLDWIAFQMAISGTEGIDGWYADSYEREKRERIESGEMEREVDEILQWWAEFGYQGWGRMVGDESFNSKGGRRGSLRVRKGREDIERSGAEKARGSPGHSEYLKKIVDTEKIVVADNAGIGGTNEVQRMWSLADSLPPSPMLELLVPNPSKDNELIPMGFNLGHDLGDFLRWETNHVQTLLTDD
jgi:hypothetical protein